jgi:hypothetical protein
MSLDLLLKPIFCVEVLKADNFLENVVIGTSFMLDFADQQLVCRVETPKDIVVVLAGVKLELFGLHSLLVVWYLSAFLF